MDLTIYSNAWKIYKANFVKLFSFSLSLMVLCIASYVAFLFLGGNDFYLVGILLLSFVVAPFFYSLQIAMLKASSGEEVDYNDYYNFFLGYYKNGNIGMYSVIRTLLFSFLGILGSIFFSSVIHDIIFPDVIENAVSSIEIDPSSINYTYEVVNTVLNIDYFMPILIICLGLGHSVFFVSVEKRLMLPYFALVGKVPLMVSSEAYNKVYKENQPDFKRYTTFGNLMFLSAFVVGFVTSGLIANLFQEQLVYVELILIIAYCGGILVSFSVLPATLIVYCFIADGLHPDYLHSLADQLVSINTALKDQGGIEELKEQQRIVDDLIKIVDEQQKKSTSEEVDDEE